MFLPETDQDFLEHKSLPFGLREERVGSEMRRGIEFPHFKVPSTLAIRQGDAYVPADAVRLLVLIPTGYAKARLDSWYVSPGLFHLDGRPIDRANGEQELFGETWQFWSRHLTDEEWRPNIDGLETYLQYIRGEFRNAA